MTSITCPTSAWVIGLLALITACTPASQQSQPDSGLRFEGVPSLGSFKLLDVQPRQYPLSGGRGILTYSGPTPDAGFVLMVGESDFVTDVTRFAGVVPIANSAGALELFVPRSDRPGTFNLSLWDSFNADAGRLGTLVGALDYVESPTRLTIQKIETGYSHDLSSPVRAELTSTCGRRREYTIGNAGDVPATGLVLAVEGDGYSLRGTCPTSLSWLGQTSCRVEICFNGSGAGEARGLLRATSNEHTVTEPLSVVVLPRRDDVAWVKPAPSFWLVGSGDQVAMYGGTSTLVIIDGAGNTTAEVPLGIDTIPLSLAGDHAGGFFVARRPVASGGEHIVHFDARGTRTASVTTEVRGLWSVSSTRLLAGSIRTLTAYTVPQLMLDRSWGRDGVVEVVTGNEFLSLAALPDGRVFATQGGPVLEFSPTGVLVKTHSQQATTLAASPTGVLLASNTREVVRLGASDTWEVLWAGESRWLTFDAQGRILEASDVGRIRRADGTIERTLTFTNAHCPALGGCFIAGHEFSESFVARLKN